MKVPEPVTFASNPIPNTIPLVTNPVVPVTAPVVIETNPVITATTLPPTNPVAAPPIENMQASPANPTATNLATATTPNSSDQPTWILIYIGIALLVVAVVLVVLLVVRPNHRPQSSLITSSMQDDPRRK
jgi:hypothetical protein